VRALARNPFLVVCTSVLMLAACGDTDLPTEEKSSLVLFKRVTIAADAPGRAEIELEVRTGAHLSQPASDGTTVTLETSAGRFANGAKVVQLSTAGGRALAELEINGAQDLQLKARVHGTETRLAVLVRRDGSLVVRAP
jgi:hypothetical protein